jgi:uncharacterized protein YndB with AHSA1/START domain
MAEIAAFDVPPVIKTVTVRCSPEAAFRRFTDEIASWWPLANFHVGADPQTVILEPRLGGRIFERNGDGVETPWGTVLAWDPPALLAFTWLPGFAEDQAQHVELRFAAVADDTVVTLTHTRWEKLGDMAAIRRERFNNGWESIVKLYAAYADQA